MSLANGLNDVGEVYVLWVSEGGACACSAESTRVVAHSSLAEAALGPVPGIPKVHIHEMALADETSDDPSAVVGRARRGELAPFVLVVEGLIEARKWIDDLAPKAWAVIAAGTCAVYGGVRSTAGNPTGAVGLSDYLGWNFRSAAGIPVVNVTGCPPSADQVAETLFWLLKQIAGKAPMIRLDAQRRPTGLSKAPFTGRGRRPSPVRIIGRYRSVFRKLRSITKQTSVRDPRQSCSGSGRNGGFDFRRPVERKAP
jgi:hydrogenase small subunit